MISQKGNALFLILIAVALFAALSYAVTQSGRGSGSIDKETAALQAARMVSYAGAIEQAIRVMMLVGGCAETDLNFNFDSDGDGDTINDTGDTFNNAGSPADHSCHVFDSAGGGVNYIPPEQLGATGYIFTGHTVVETVGCSSASNACPELTMAVQGISQNACLHINQTIRDTSVIRNDNFNQTEFVGTFTHVVGGGSTIAVGSGGEIDPLSGCIVDSGSTYYYYSVLLAR